MTSPAVSRVVAALAERMAPFLEFLGRSRWAERYAAADPAMCDFVAGNPQEMPLPEFTRALARALEPRNKDWFAYKLNETAPREAVAASLARDRSIPFEPEDVFLTPGTFGALAVALRTIADAGDEVVFLSPPWFFYEGMIAFTGAVPVRVTLSPPTFDLDVDAIAAAVSPRTRAVIVNTPQNPTGRIYPPEALQRLASVLDDASERNGRPVYLLADESYCRILYDGNAHVSPAAFYSRTLLLYTYGKTLLTPGQRLGYIALPPSMPRRGDLRTAVSLTQMAIGWAFPNALMQHALPELDGLSIDVAHLQRKRDRLVEALRGLGYEVNRPQGTFYLLVRSPLADDLEFVRILADHDVYVLPGRTFELPGYFRISVTATDDMIERALPGFEASLGTVRGVA